MPWVVVKKYESIPQADPQRLFVRMRMFSCRPVYGNLATALWISLDRGSKVLRGVLRVQSCATVMSDAGRVVKQVVVLVSRW